MDIPIFKKITYANEHTMEKMTRWMYDWWGRDEGLLREAVKCFVEHSMKDDRLPQTYGLFLDGELIGMYQFVYDDLMARPDVYPWLANVYIDEDHRGRGFGRLLMENIKNTALENTAFDTLYLYTEHSGLYEKFGWEFVENIDTFIEGKRIQRLYALRLER